MNIYLTKEQQKVLKAILKQEQTAPTSTWHVNGLDTNLCSTVCNPIEKAIVNIIGRYLYEEWTSFSNLIVDDLVKLIDEKLNGGK